LLIFTSLPFTVFYWTLKTEIEIKSRSKIILTETETERKITECEVNRN